MTDVDWPLGEYPETTAAACLEIDRLRRDVTEYRERYIKELERLIAELRAETLTWATRYDTLRMEADAWRGTA